MSALCVLMLAPAAFAQSTPDDLTGHLCGNAGRGAHHAAGGMTSEDWSPPTLRPGRYQLRSAWAPSVKTLRSSP